jgi:hypothetical protein
MLWKRWSQDSQNAEMKDFTEAIAPFEGRIKYQPIGITSIKIAHIVGSVGRAHELDKNFHYRKRHVTERYSRSAIEMMRGGASRPIKVYMLKREDSVAEYYVLDGHHRVATAIQEGFDEINAEIIEAIVE